MTETYGISHGGQSAEELFRSLTGATRSLRASSGDALLDGYPVEIKRATSATLNQVRAVKYIPLVAYDERSGRWFVMPAHVVVREVSRKSRGQHTENPFESSTLSLNRLQDYQVEAGELRSRVLDAIETSSRYPGLRAEMVRILEESRHLATESVTWVGEVLRQLGLE